MRKLTLESGVWGWRAGTGNVVIRNPQGKSTIVSYEDLTGLSPYDIENMQDNRTFAVKPSWVRAYIEKRLL